MLPLLVLLACGGGPSSTPAAVVPPVALGPEDVAVATMGPISAGPRISGTLEAAEKAVLRAEVGGTVLVVAVEVGQRVNRGDVLARVEDTSVKEALTSANAALAASEQDVAVAEREAARARRLVEAGAMAARDQEGAERGVAGAKAALEAARARVVQAREQLESTTVRSPLAGVVAERAVGEGDVVAPGSPLFTVLDPATLRLEGAVPADAVAALRVGAPVTFTVQGHPGRTFAGTIARVAPAVDAATRQIPVIVDVPNPEGVLLAGLFAEGQVATEQKEGLVVPADALAEAAGKTTVARVANGKVESVAVEVGLRDPATERVELTSGVQAGDTVLVGAARDVPAGAAVSLRGGE